MSRRRILCALSGDRWQRFNGRNEGAKQLLRNDALAYLVRARALGAGDGQSLRQVAGSLHETVAKLHETVLKRVKNSTLTDWRQPVREKRHVALHRPTEPD